MHFRRIATFKSYQTERVAVVGGDRNIGSPVPIVVNIAGKALFAGTNAVI